MNTAHWHLLFNHLPIVGSIIGTLILLTGYFLKSRPLIKQTGLGVLVFTALTALPAFFTGEGAEDIVEKMPGVTEQLIESHEDIGKIFLTVVLITGVLSLISLAADYLKKSFSSVLYILVFLTAISSCILAQQTGTSGGEIRHTEIRSGATAQTNATQEQVGTGEKDDD